MHIHKITIHYGLIRAIKLHNSFFLTLGYRIQMHVSTIQGNFNKLLTSKTTKASINEKIFMINKTQWGEFQCFFYRIVFCRYTGRGSSYFVIFGSKELSWNATIMNSEDWLSCKTSKWVQNIFKVPIFANFWSEFLKF